MKITLSILIFFFGLTAQACAQNERPISETKGLQVGVKAPDFSGLASDSSKFELKKAIEKGPVVLMFYRGYWCPVCNKHLAKVQDSLNFILSLKANVVAISPEQPELLKKMAEKTGAQFTLLYDEKSKISGMYDVSYSVTTAQRYSYNAIGANLKRTDDEATSTLPIPATYIIDRNGTIVWRHFNPDYKKRASVKEITEVLKTL